MAALGKLYSEAIEGIDPGPIEAIQATGATRLQTIMYAVVPQMISPFVSFSIYRWDVNVRMSTVIGLVVGGGVVGGGVVGGGGGVSKLVSTVMSCHPSDHCSLPLT